MGTRHMIGVKMNGEWKVGQYGQWDGYPEGQGYTVLNFLRECNMDIFRSKLDRCIFIDKKRLRECYVEAGDSKDNTSGFIDMAVANKFNAMFPMLCRDTGAEILNLIYKSDAEKIELFDNHDFINDTTFCEFAYVVNLDENKLVCYASNKVFAEYDLTNIPDNEDMLADYNRWYKNNEE